MKLEGELESRLGSGGRLQHSLSLEAEASRSPMACKTKGNEKCLTVQEKLMPEIMNQWHREAIDFRFVRSIFNSNTFGLPAGASSQACQYAISNSLKKNCTQKKIAPRRAQNFLQYYA